MTDKQIIINGIDVSRCKHYKNRNCIADYCLTDMPFSEAKCELNTNCYYKQLKRKEQSEVKLVGQIQTICDFINNRPETFKGIYGGVDKIITEYAERKEKECEKLKTQILSLQTTNIEELKNYKQTLAEIKQMLKEICMEECSFDWNKTSKKHCGDCDCRYGQILQKISECEVE